MASQAFERFSWSCFDGSWHAQREGLDTLALLSLAGDERLEAESMILDAIRTTTDTRPYEAAGWLRLPKAAELLKQQLTEPNPPKLIISAAWALHRIEQWPEAADTILQQLRSKPLDSSLWWHTTVLLRYVEPSPKVIVFLVRVLVDETLPKELIATNAASIKQVGSGEAGAWAWGEVPELPQTFVTPPSSDARTSDEQLLLQAHVLADRFDVFDRNQILEVLELYRSTAEGVEALQAVDLQALDTLTKSVVHSLEEHQDVSAAPVAGLLRAWDAVAALRGLLGSSQGRTRVDIALALYRIGAFDDTVDVILGVLQSDAHQYDRWQAIKALQEIGASSKVLAVLLEIVQDDTDSFVGKKALDALVDLCKENPLPIDLVDRVESQIVNEDVKMDNGHYRIDVVQRPAIELMEELRHAVSTALNIPPFEVNKS